jgi:hypothetical protein
MYFIFGYMFLPSAEEMCVCVWRGGGYFFVAGSIYECFSSHVYERKDILAQRFHSGVGNDILFNQLHHIIAKIQHFDILQTSYALIISEQ